MTDTTTSPPTTSSTPRRTSARPSVSVRPLAVGAANAATIAGATAVAAGGGIVLAALAGGGVLAATAVAGRKTRQTKAQRTSTVKTVRSSAGSVGRSGGGGGMPRLGRSGSGSPGGRAPGSKPSPTPRGAGGRPTGGAKSSGLGGLLGNRPGRGAGGGAAGGRTSGAGGGRSGAAGTLGHRRAGSKPGAGNRTPLTGDRVAAARRKLANRRQPGPRMSDAVRSATTPNAAGSKPTARQAFANARRGVAGDNPKRRGFVRRAAAGLLAGAVAWDKTQRAEWQRRKKVEAARKAKADRIAAAKQGKPGVDTTVRRPANTTDQTNNTRKPAPMPVRPTPGTCGGTTVLPESGACVTCGGRHSGLPNNTLTNNASKGTMTMVHPLLAISEDFLEAARRNQPEGMLQVTAEARILAAVMENLTKAMKIRYDRAQAHPLHPDIKEMYGTVHLAQFKVMEAASEIHPAIEKAHKDLLDRLRNPALGEEMWDVARNRGAE